MTTIDFSQVFSQTFERAKVWWQVLLPVAALWSLIMGVVVALIISVIIGSAIGVGVASGNAGAGILSGLAALAVGIPLIIFVAVVISVIQSGAMFHACAEFDAGGTPTVGESFRVGGNIAPLMQTGFVFGGIALLAGLLVIIPILGWLALLALAVWFGTRWVFTSAVVVNEGLTGMDALRRSREIVDSSGQFWMIFGVLFVMGAIGGVASRIVTSVLGIVVNHLPLAIFFSSVVSVVANCATAVLVAIATYTMYRQLTEPADAAALGAATVAGGVVAPPPAPPAE